MLSICIHPTNHCPLDSAVGFAMTSPWIVIYPADNGLNWTKLYLPSKYHVSEQGNLAKILKKEPKENAKWKSRK